MTSLAPGEPVDSLGFNALAPPVAPSLMAAQDLSIWTPMRLGEALGVLLTPLVAEFAGRNDTSV